MKKKIAILTLRLNNNYGGLLQAYALNNFLCQLGFDATTLKIEEEQRQYSLGRRTFTFLWRIMKRIVGDTSIEFLDVQKQKRVYNTAGIYQTRFIEQNIHTLCVKLPLSADFQMKMQFDGYIVGSDQVWRGAFVSDLKNYFLDFVPAETKKLSYAASFGIDQFTVLPSELPVYRRLLSRFDGISVREKEGKAICKEMVPNKVIEWLIDPTLLIPREEYERIVEKSGYVVKAERVLLVYILDISAKNTAIIKHLAKKLRLKPKFIGKLKGCSFPSIEDWLAGYMQADFVITDSFHGSVFSLVFNVPFLSIENVDRGSSRFISLFEKFAIHKNRLLSNVEAIENKDEEWLINGIDFNDVNKIIEQEKVKSEQFIKLNLT